MSQPLKLNCGYLGDHDPHFFRPNDVFTRALNFFIKEEKLKKKYLCPGIMHKHSLERDTSFTVKSEMIFKCSSCLVHVNYNRDSVRALVTGWNPWKEIRGNRP